MYRVLGPPIALHTSEQIAMKQNNNPPSVTSSSMGQLQWRFEIKEKGRYLSAPGLLAKLLPGRQLRALPLRYELFVQRRADAQLGLGELEEIGRKRRS